MADPRFCASRLCQYDKSRPVSFWVTTKEVEGCDCCLLSNGTMVADGATWWDTSVTPPLMLECCRGQILTPAPPPTPLDCGEYGVGI